MKKPEKRKTALFFKKQIFDSDVLELNILDTTAKSNILFICVCLAYHSESLSKLMTVGINECLEEKVKK